MNTNREKIIRAFDALEPRRAFAAEPAPARRIRPRLVFALCALTLLLGMAAAYAADLGGLRETLVVWIQGRQVEGSLESTDGGYILTDESGEIVMMGSGVVIEPDGTQRPMTAGEMTEFFQDSTSVMEDEDGTIWFYYQNYKVDITHSFDEKGKARVELPGKRTLRRFTIAREIDGTYSVGMTNGGYILTPSE